MKKTYTFFLMVFVLIFIQSQLFSAIIYVDAGKSNDDGNGLSWTNAKKTLKAALDLSVSGDKIWVKAGTYYPTGYATGNNDPSTVREKCFQMKNGVEIYGGFAGTEGSDYDLSLRDFIANETILSGDIGTKDDNTDNCFHVFYNTNISPELTNSAILDGFTIRDGYADRSYNENNFDKYSDKGAGILNGQPSLMQYPKLKNIIFTNNYSIGEGGGLYSIASMGLSLINCLFTNNQADKGGAIFLKQDGNFINVTIYNNSANYGGGVYFTNVTYTAGSSFYNFIVWGNTASISGNQFHIDYYGNLNLYYSCYSNNNNDVVTDNGGWFNPDYCITSNPKFIDAPGGDLRVYGNSPCVNTGNNYYNTAAKDLRGRDRIQNTTIDMGAYEWTSGVDPNTRIYYVDASKTSGLNDGTSWTNAYLLLQSALTAAVNGDQIWVAKGTYYPTQYAAGNPYTSNPKEKCFQMKEGVGIYGGFAGSEAFNYDISLRDFVSNETRLSGDIGTEGVNTDNCYHVIYNLNNSPTLTNTAILDGFTIRDGYAQANFIIPYFDNYSYNGAGIYNSLQNPLLRNIIFTNNISNEGNGGGLYCAQSNNLLLINCIFKNNQASTGGAIYCEYGNTTFTNVTVVNNSSYFGGGVYFLSSGAVSGPVFNNCIIWGNNANYNGKQLYINFYPTTLNNSCYSNGANDVALANGGTFITNSCITSDPKFVNASGGDFRLYGVSPCADAGNNSYNTLANDIRGNGFGRKLNKTDGTNGTIDMGAYEYKYDSDPYYYPPDVQASNITFSSVGLTSFTINWTNGNGSNRIVCVKEGTGSITNPSDNTTYTASSDWSSKGTQLGGSGYYCVYNNSSNTVTVTNLSPGTTYYVQIFEYNGIAGSEVYLTTTATNNPNNKRTTAIIYIDAAKADDSGDGLSWATAKKTFQAGLETALSGDQIWVKTGTYKPTVEVGGTGDRYKAFQMKQGIAIYGGFAGSETQLTARDWKTNETILSGDIGTIGDNSDNAYHVIYNYLDYLTSATTLDGFTIRDGNADGAVNNSNNAGGGIFFYYSSPSINNCKVISNNATYAGGLFLSRSNSLVMNTIISGNTQGVYLSDGSPTILNCLISGNYFNGSTASGLGLNSGQYSLANFKIINTTISGNKSSSVYSAMDGQIMDSQMELDNCIIWNNENAEGIGTASANYSVNPSLSTITFKNNLIQNYTTADANGNLDGFANATNSNYPKFVEPIDLSTVPTNAGDFRLYDNSPCMNTGNNSYNNLSTDIRGEARIQNTTIDMGAYEWTSGVDPTCTNPTNGGTIATTQIICSGSAPAAFTNEATPTGHTGDLEYKWQLSTTNGTSGYSDIESSNSTTYTAEELTQTTWFRRLSRVDCMDDWSTATSSNTIEVTVLSLFISGAISTTGETICYGGNPIEIESSELASGGDESITYKWQLSTTNSTSGFSDIESTDNQSYDSPNGLTQTTWYRRLAKDGTCNTTFETSTGVWKVTVRPQFTSGAISTTGETICYNGNPGVIGSTTAASGGDNDITYKWQLSTTNSSSGFTDIESSSSATYDPAALTQTTWYQRLAKDGTCNSFTASTGVWEITVRPQFTAGDINTTGETICYNGNPSVIGSTTAASGGDNDITYKWQLSTTNSSSGFSDIESTDNESYEPPNGLTQTTWYRRLAKDGTCNTTFEISTGVWQISITPIEVWVNSTYNDQTPGWGETHFDNITDAVANVCLAGTVNISNYSHTGDVDMTGYTFIIGSQDFVLDGELTGGVIRTISTGYLSLIPTQNTQIIFPVTDGTNNETIKITCLNNPSQNIRVRIKNNQNITGGLTNPMDLWDFRGQNSMNATITFRIDKAQIAPKKIYNWSALRWFNGTRYELLPPENITVAEFDTYYEITVTGINQFSHE